MPSTTITQPAQSPPCSFLQILDPLLTTMDFSGKSPRRQLQGPRPTPLKVRKDSHKIRKPPVVPQQQSQPQQIHRPPVIIYTVSPKIIHANPNEFMQLVQRLTGPNSSTTNSSLSTVNSSSYFQDNSGSISPAARFASLEKIKSPEGKQVLSQGCDIELVGGIDIRADIDRITGMFPGILSPEPGSLARISPNLFSPPSNSNPLGNFFHDLSPVLHSNKNYMEISLVPSPSNKYFSPNLTYSPTSSVDLFNNLFDY